ncbi:MAG: hypothetical protein IPN69_09175 [Acidobacteria bacterium]|nr:hypothetical protein [Acidobacteriota bacterium]
MIKARLWPKGSQERSSPHDRQSVHRTKAITGGTDLYSRNFAWGTSLVGLAGRAGLDAGFGISYNSLV